MTQPKIHGVPPILEAAEARTNVQNFLNAADQGNIQNYEDYLTFANSLPRSLGSLVLHYGLPDTTRSEHRIEQRHENWDIIASAQRSSEYIDVKLSRQHRYLRIGRLEQSSLIFSSDDPSTGQATQDVRHEPLRTYRLHTLGYAHPEALNPKVLQGFLTVSQVVIQDLLGVIRAKS